MQRTQPVRHNLWPRKYIKYQTAQNGTSYKAMLKECKIFKNAISFIKCFVLAKMALISFREIMIRRT